MKIFTKPLYFLWVASLLVALASFKVTYHSNKLSRLLEESIDSKFEFNVQTNNMYFKRISENLESMEQAYKDCLNSLSNSNFTEEAVDSCLGHDMIYVLNDIDYEKSQIIGRADSKIRAFLLEYCYKNVDNGTGANSCDLLERDILELLWNEFNFGTLIDYHKSKYLGDMAEVPDSIFNKVVPYLQNLYGELNELLDEIQDHSIIIRANIKRAIDIRTRVILEEAEENVNNPKPKIIKHTIEIEERIITPNYLTVNHVARNIALNGSRVLEASENSDNSIISGANADAVSVNQENRAKTVKLGVKRMPIETHNGSV